MRQTDRKLGALEQTRVNVIHPALPRYMLHVHVQCAILEVSQVKFKLMEAESKYWPGCCA